jgi:hypothetical protein
MITWAAIFAILSAICGSVAVIGAIRQRRESLSLSSRVYGDPIVFDDGDAAGNVDVTPDHLESVLDRIVRNQRPSVAQIAVAALAVVFALVAAALSL